MGYDCRWGIVRASEAGSAHQRKRLFIWGETSDPPSVGCEQGAGQLAPEKRRQKTFRGGRDIEPSRSFTTATDTGSKRHGREQDTGTVADSTRQMEGETQQQRTRRQPEYRSSEAFNWRQYETAIRRWETVIDRPAPIPVDDKGVNPVFVEWLMGLPEGHVTDLGLSRSAELKMLGNGVVPQQAHLALEILTEGGVYAA